MGDYMFSFIEEEEVELDTKSEKPKNYFRCFFDLECTLKAEDGDIVQLAVIVTDWEFNIVDVYTEIYKTHVPLREQEIRVHKIDETMVKQNATRHFTEALDYTPLRKYKDSTVFISYTLFDVHRVNSECEKYGTLPVDFGKEVSTLAADLSDGKVCHYNAYRDGKKKGELVAKELGEQAFKDIYKEMEKFGTFQIRGSHDALYDSVMMLALCRRNLSWRDFQNK